MLTFSSLGSGSYKIVGGKKPVIVFPPDRTTDASVLKLASSPEEKKSDDVISWPGEYNEYEVSIRGVGHEEGQQISYVVEVDGVRCGCLSSPLREWSDKQLEAVGDLDVLAIPAEELKLVQKLVDEFDPRVLFIIPSKEKSDLDAVSKAVGVRETVNEYKVKSLPAEGREVIVLA